MIILSPGPANISERVRTALLLPDICHRDAEFSDLLAEIRQNLLKVCAVGEGFKSVVFSGSGTLAVESALSALSGWDKKVFVISNGTYGERAAAICRLYGVPKEEMRLPWGELPDLNTVEAELKRDHFGAVYIVHHETTTGLLNPLADVAGIARRKGKLMLVDGISSIAGEALDLEGWGIDMITGSANKCIRGVPGASFTVVSDRFIQEIEACRISTFYGGFLRHLNAEENGETPFTPAVQVFYAFREALRETLEDGIYGRIERYRSVAKRLRDGLGAVGLAFYIPEAVMSNTMTTVYLPGGFDYATLHDRCKQNGYVIYPSQGDLAGKTFRLGTVGIISDSDIDNFLNVLRSIILP